MTDGNANPHPNSIDFDGITRSPWAMDQKFKHRGPKPVYLGAGSEP